MLGVAYRSSTPLLLVADVKGARPEPVRVGIIGEWRRDRPFRYGEAVDYLLGLPRGGTHPQPRATSTTLHSEFPIDSPALSWERWHGTWTKLTATVEEGRGSLHIAVDLVPCDDCTATEIEVGRGTLQPCAGYMGEHVRCVGQTARYPRRATQLHATIDLAGI